MEERAGSGRVDERTIMFSRAELEPGTERYRLYYQDHPDHLEPDSRFRALPGLLQPGSQFFDPLLFNAADANFRTVACLHPNVDGEVNPVRTTVVKEKLTTFILNWCLSLGAHSAGVTVLKPDHLYTTGGRKHNYGEPVENSHRLAIAFTVEMDYGRVKMAPRAPVTLESSSQYLKAGTIAVTLAALLRNLGYPARAHIDGHYQVRCPQVARDAGLGEIGRMSLLITPRLGPRVRIAVVTTDAPLECNTAKADPSVAGFCRLCNKCAVNCPARAIPSGVNPNPDRDWTISQEDCYTYWCKAGTDCGRCLSVCPYSHRSNPIHDTVRLLIRKAGFFRRIAVPLDDWFYGRIPRIRKMNGWM